jgi:hypothetical protein
MDSGDDDAELGVRQWTDPVGCHHVMVSERGTGGSDGIVSDCGWTHGKVMRSRDKRLLRHCLVLLFRWLFQSESTKAETSSKFFNSFLKR